MTDIRITKVTGASWISPDHVTCMILSLEEKLSYREIIQQSAWWVCCTAKAQISVSRWFSSIVWMFRELLENKKNGINNKVCISTCNHSTYNKNGSVSGNRSKMRSLNLYSWLLLACTKSPFRFYPHLSNTSQWQWHLFRLRRHRHVENYSKRLLIFCMFQITKPKLFQ